MNSTTTELRETEVERPAPRPGGKQTNPTRIFVDRDRTAFFWFLIALLAVGIAVLTPYFLITKFKQRERVVVIDPAGTYFISPVLDFQEARELHAQQATLAALAFLARNPTGFDHPELLKLMFLKTAFDKASRQFSSEAAEFKSKQLHQKVEIAKIDILETRQNLVLTRVTGQLIRAGIFEGKAFSEALPFTVSFKMQRNPDMTNNGRFPTAIADYKYEPAR